MGRTKDPRMLTSKEYQKKVFSELSTVLLGLDYPHAISQGWITNPSLKDFLDITEFLTRQIFDTNFVLPRQKYEEYVPKLAKYIGYPYAFQKNWLNPVGAPNTWPHLIGFLDFLIQMAHVSRIYKVSERK